jgi:sarcosine oxidase subunit gamma
LAARLGHACDSHASIVDQSCGHAALRLSGARARDVLAKGCRIDLHPRAFGVGRAAATIIAHVHGIVWQIDESPTFELIVPSTFAEHVFEWLCLSAAEFGYEVIA